MAKAVRVGHGMEQEVRIMREVSEGVHPRLAVKVAPYLPIQGFRYKGREKNPIVIRKGELIGLDQWNQYVPANGGVLTANGLTYSQDDADWNTPSYSGAASYGAGAVATPAQQEDLPANKVVGYAYTDFYQVNTKDLNYRAALENNTVSTDWMIQVPIVTAGQQLARQGDLVIPDSAAPGQWRSVVAADYATVGQIRITNENAVGKVYKIDKITDHMNKQDIIQTAPGLGIHGGIEAPGGAGVPNFLTDAASHSRPDNVAGGNVTGKYTAHILVRI